MVGDDTRIEEVKGGLSPARRKPTHESQFLSRTLKYSMRRNAVPMGEVWLALHMNIRSVLKSVTLADIANDRLPKKLLGLAAEGESLPEKRRGSQLVAANWGGAPPGKKAPHPAASSDGCR